MPQLNILEKNCCALCTLFFFNFRAKRAQNGSKRRIALYKCALDKIGRLSRSQRILRSAHKCTYSMQTIKTKISEICMISKTLISCNETVSF